MKLAHALILGLTFSVILFAADPTGSITGSVSDPSGAAVTKAHVTVVQTSTGLTRETNTASDGGFVFPLLPVGTYTVIADNPGFRKFEQREVVVAADASVTLSIQMRLGDVAEAVTVSASASMVETRSGALGQVVTTQKITELPLNGRNAATLVLLAPGTADLSASNAGGAGDVLHNAVYPGGQAITSNGSRSEGINYFLDGASNLDPWTNSNNPFPNPDALDEFSVQTNNYSAEFGRAAGAVVNIITKSGSNQVHGALFEFVRNGAFNARNFFANDTDKLKRNQYGASVGGPILKDKLFFFGTWQGTKLRNISSANSAFVLTSAERNGNFSAISRQLVDPVTGTPFAGNIIPVSRFNPVSQKLLPLIPVSNSADGLVTFQAPQRDDENQFMGRIDYNTSRNRLYGRFFHTELNRAKVSGAQNLLVAAPGFDYLVRSFSISDTYSLSANLLNNFVFGSSRNDTQRLSGAPFGLDTLGVAIGQPAVPEIAISVAGYFSISSGRQGEFERPSYNISDSVHWVKGIHELAFGGDLLRMQTNVDNTYRMSGNFRFRGSAFSGNALSDFLLGQTDRFIQGAGDFRSQRVTQIGLFVQDNIRVSRKLTVNLGLRWDPWIPYGEELGRIPCFVPGAKSSRFPNAPVGEIFQGDSGCPDGGSRSRYSQFGPRLGFAYKLDPEGRTVIRGAGGLFYQPPFTEAFGTLMTTAPFSPQFYRYNVPFNNPYVGGTNPFPSEFGPKIPDASVKFDLPVVGASLTPGWRPSQVATWNLTVERQLTRDAMLRVAYAASKGSFLPYNTDANLAPVAGGSVRPYSNFDTVIIDNSGANSIYNALQVSVDKRLGHGLTVGANYTYGKTIDEVSYTTDVCSVNVINPYNIRAYRAVSDFDIPHRFVLNYLWELPTPKHNAVLKNLAGGWQSSGVLNWQSGFPLTIYSGEDNSGTAIGFDVADVVGKPSLTSGSLNNRIAQWFTTSAFATNAPGTFGNAGRNILRGPGTFNVDWSLQKLFVVRERWRLQFRAEFFNVLNHTQLDNPGTTVTSGDFGRITSARAPRSIQLGLKLIF